MWSVLTSFLGIDLACLVCYSVNMNPIKEIRQREGLSQEDFARAVEIHPQAVLLNEAGCYPTILPKIESWLEENGYTVSEIRVNYRDFVINKRQSLVGKFDGVDFDWASFSFTNHPFTNFRLLIGLSRMGFAKRFCVQPAVLYKLERGDSQGLGGQIKEALLGAGFEKHFIDELNERCIEWATVKPTLTQEAATS